MPLRKTILSTTEIKCYYTGEGKEIVFPGRNVSSATFYFGFLLAYLLLLFSWKILAAIEIEGASLQRQSNDNFS